MGTARKMLTSHTGDILTDQPFPVRVRMALKPRDHTPGTHRPRVHQRDSRCKPQVTNVPDLALTTTNEVDNLNPVVTVKQRRCDVMNDDRFLMCPNPTGD